MTARAAQVECGFAAKGLIGSEYAVPDAPGLLCVRRQDKDDEGE